MKYSIIVPCYNEAKDIVCKSKLIIEKLNELKIQFELILVNDGSKDETKVVLDSINYATIVSYEPNRGKGGAIKEGILHADGDFVLFMDADLSTDLEAITKIDTYVSQFDMIIGSRHLKDSQIPIKQPFIRRFIGFWCRFLVNLIFGFHYKDTQCGFKAIRTKVAKEFANKQIINNFAFDVEYLYIAKLNKLSVKEIPVIWRDDRGSTVSPIKSSIKFFKDIFKIRHNKKNYYL